MINWRTIYYGELGCATSGTIYEITLCENINNNITTVYLILHIQNSNNIIEEYLLTDHTKIETEERKAQLKKRATIEERKKKIDKLFLGGK